MIKSVSVAGLEQGSPYKKPGVQLEEAAKIVSIGSLTWVECVVDNFSETPKILQNLGITMDPTALLAGYVSEYDDRGDTLGIMLPFVVIGNNKLQTSPLLIFIKKDLIVTIHDDYGGKITKLFNYSNTFLKKLPQEPDKWTDRQTILLARMIDELAETNFSILRIIVERAEQLEVDLAGSRQVERDIPLELSEMKTSNLTFLNAVWAAYDTVHNLKYGDAETISDDPTILAKFEVILVRLDRQIQMSENVIQMISTGTEVLQTAITNKMTILVIWWTVAGTAELVPNTIATVMGLLPNHEQFITWELAIIIGSAALATCVTYFYVRKWFGKGLGINRFKRFRKKGSKIA